MLWLLLACDSGNANWSQRFEENPTKIKEELISIDNPLMRMQIIQEITKDLPGQSQELCSLIEDFKAKEQCITLNKRPHLWMNNKEDKTTVAKADIEGTIDLPCKNEDLDLCVQQLAIRAAKSDSPNEAISICAQLEQGKWRDECMFIVAESSVIDKGSKAYGTAVELCKEAGGFAENCRQHLIMQMSKKAPDSDSRSDWTAIFSAHSAIATAWGWRDKKKMVAYQNRLWAEALGHSFSGVNKITGNAFDVVPVEYHPHVRAAAARRMLQLEEASKQSLQQWAATLSEYLQRRSERPASLNQQRHFLAVADLWNDHDGEQGLNYLATSRRLSSDDPLVDLQICILEAVARRPPVAKKILLEGQRANSDLVQKTATRLLK